MPEVEAKFGKKSCLFSLNPNAGQGLNLHFKLSQLLTKVVLKFMLNLSKNEAHHPEPQFKIMFYYSRWRQRIKLQPKGELCRHQIWTGLELKNNIIWENDQGNKLSLWKTVTRETTNQINLNNLPFFNFTFEICKKE